MSGDFNDIFNQMFRGQQHRQHQQITKPLIVRMEVTLEQMFSGKTLNVKINREHPCGTCDGKGGMNTKNCSPCNGRGMVTRDVMVGPGMFSRQQSICGSCKGQGFVYDKQDECKDCRG